MVLMLVLAFVVVFTPPVGAAGWEGQWVKISKGTLLCDFVSMQTALTLQTARDHDSVQALINRGSCTRAPNDLFATVVKDASTFTEPNLAQIMVKGISLWGAMKDMNCCYERKRK